MVLADVGECVHLARLNAGLTQQAAADAADIDVKRWQRIEAGDVNCTIKTLVAVAAATGTDLWSLLRLQDRD